MTGVETETGIIETEKIEGRQVDGTMMIETEIEEEEDDTTEMMTEETEENQDGVEMMTEEIEIAETEPRMLEADSRTWRREAVVILFLCWICRIFPNLMEREDLVTLIQERIIRTTVLLHLVSLLNISLLQEVSLTFLV